MTFKGFGRPPAQNAKKIVSLYNQLLVCASFVNTKNVRVLVTERKYKESLAIAVNEISKNFVGVYFGCYFHEEHSVAAIVTEPDIEICDYTVVKQSAITKKWMVLASPPGSYSLPRDLNYWYDKNKAIEVAKNLNSVVKSFSVSDWDNRTEKYREFLHELPDDESQILGTYYPGSEQVVVNPSLESPNLVHKLIKDHMNDLFL